MLLKLFESRPFFKKIIMTFKYTNLLFARDYSFKWYSAWHLNYAPICFMNSNQIFKLLRNDLVIRTNIIRIIEYVYRYISDYDEGWVFQISFNQMWVFKYCFCRVYIYDYNFSCQQPPFSPLPDVRMWQNPKKSAIFWGKLGNR